LGSEAPTKKIILNRRKKMQETNTKFISTNKLITTTNLPQFSIYRAKDLFKEAWNDQGLQYLVSRARGSYLRYGEVPVYDSYDPKSAIYLIKASYTGENEKIKGAVAIQEWLSVRFIPWGGAPEDTEDFTHCHYKGKNIREIINNNLFKGEDKINQLVTISRICSAQYALGPRGHYIELLGQKNKYTSESFVLANQAFLDDYNKSSKFSYLTGLFRKELLKKFTVKINGGKQLPTFIPAYKSLGISDKNSIRITRDDYIFSFPSYFLNLKETLKILRKLWKRGNLSNKTLAYNLGENIVWDNFFNFEKPLSLYHYKNLGKLFNKNSKLHDSLLTSAQLRSIINSEVSDGPELKIMELSKWTQEIKKCVQGIRGKIIRSNYVKKTPAKLYLPL
jgi:hypothetical protein